MSGNGGEGNSLTQSRPSTTIFRAAHATYQWTRFPPSFSPLGYPITRFAPSFPLSGADSLPSNPSFDFPSNPAYNRHQGTSAAYIPNQKRSSVEGQALDRRVRQFGSTSEASGSILVDNILVESPLSAIGLNLTYDRQKSTTTRVPHDEPSLVEEQAPDRDFLEQGFESPSSLPGASSNVVNGTPRNGPKIDDPNAWLKLAKKVIPGSMGWRCLLSRVGKCKYEQITTRTIIKRHIEGCHLKLRHAFRFVCCLIDC